MSKKLQDKIDQLELLLEHKDVEIRSFKKELIVLNEQIESLLNRIQKQVEFTNKIQSKLVPTEIPSVTGFEFSSKFIASAITGGDYYDIFEIEDKFRFSILLSSCSGYSISSLFLVILLKLMSHIETKKGAAPEKVLNLILEELLVAISEKDKANIFYGLINKRTYDLTYCHAGENFIYHYEANKKSSYEIKPNLPSIEKKFKKKIVSQTVHLNPKDRLVFISEGINHVVNNNGISFPREKIMDLIEGESKATVHEVRNEILFQIQKWSGKKELKKDITVLVAEVKERVLKLAKS